jgi:hypothetical protein
VSIVAKSAALNAGFTGFIYSGAIVAETRPSAPEKKSVS